MKSRLHADDLIYNSDRKFGAADEYLPFEFVAFDGGKRFGLFASSEVAVALSRGNANPEDRPLSLWQSFLGFFK